MRVDKVDFAIITILLEEYDAIDARFAPDPDDVSSGYTYGFSQVQTKAGKTSTVAIARTSGQGNDISQQLASRMIADLDPQILLVVGIGGGIPDKDFTLGDVVVSSYIHNFDLNALKAGTSTFNVTGGIHPRVSEITANLPLYKRQLAGWNTEDSIDQPRPKTLLTDELLQTSLDKHVDEEWRNQVVDAFQWHFGMQQRGARPPKYITGTIASSNTLVRDDALLARWLQTARSIRAVEMETAGVYQAAQYLTRQYPVMAIRGISDIVGFKRDDDWKQYACHTAAAFAHAFVASDIIKPREATPASLPPHSTTPNSSSTPSSGVSQEPAARPNGAIKIFTIFADADATSKERLDTQLAVYTLNNTIELWDRTMFSAGSEQELINRYIDAAEIVLLLISPFFPASRQCYIEMTRAMERQQKGEVVVIPIYIRPTDWEDAPFNGLLSLPRDRKPVNNDMAWYNVTLDIRKAFNERRARRTSSS